MIYDIIGDIHGQADKLRGLLARLGYRDNGRFFEPPVGHQAIFIGDFIDRGAKQLETLQIVFDMIDHGAAKAVMGNHEFNGIGYAVAHPDGGYCRPRSAQNTEQHRAFLDEAPLDSPQHTYWINRLYELPLWLELPCAHIVHACFDEAAMALLKPLLDEQNRLNQPALIAMSTPNTPEFAALERVLKGVESQLPCGITLTDGHGIVRRRTRIKWWLDDWQNRPLLEVAQLGSSSHLNLTDATCLPTPTDFTLVVDKPIFIGHYWLDGTPQPLSDQVVCVDYSAGKGGYLTAYRFDESMPTLSADNFIQYRHDD